MKYKPLTKPEQRKKRKRNFILNEQDQYKRNKLHKLTFKKIYKQFKKSSTFISNDYKQVMKALGKTKKQVFHKNKISKLQSKIDLHRNAITSNSRN